MIRRKVEGGKGNRIPDRVNSPQRKLDKRQGADSWYNLRYNQIARRSRRLNSEEQKGLFALPTSGFLRFIFIINQVQTLEINNALFADILRQN